MGLLDSVIGAIGAQDGTAAGGTAQGGNALQAVIAMLVQGGQGGGLGGLVQQFQQGGLGDLVASWIGSGRNLPVSPDQLESVLGSDTLTQFAQQLGLPKEAAAGQLSQILPQVVDRLTPDGQLPAADQGMGDIGSVLARFSQP